MREKAHNLHAMTSEFVVTVILGLVQLAGLLILGRMLRQNTAQLEQITAAVSINVLQGRPIEQVLQEMRESG